MKIKTELADTQADPIPQGYLEEFFHSVPISNPTGWEGMVSNFIIPPQKPILASFPPVVRGSFPSANPHISYHLWARVGDE